MAALTIVSFLIGALLGRRPVLVLLPAFSAGLVAVAALAAVTAMSLAQGAIACGLLALGLQLGYAAGFLGDFLLAASRTPRLRGGSTAIVRGRS